MALALLAAACSAELEFESADDATVDQTEESIVVDEDDPGAPSVEGEESAENAANGQADGLTWEACEQIECATIQVPADYRQPDGDTITVAVGRSPATDPERRIGTLFVNPGGPGGSAVELVGRIAAGADSVPETSELVARFDLVGVEPRGVGESEPEFACGEPGEYNALWSQISSDWASPDDVALAEKMSQLCLDSMDPMAGLVGTQPHVRDIDEVRQALGEDQISFLGFSYGSVLGAWYATLFPDNVRAMVIDGANNPVDDIDDVAAEVESMRQEIEPIERLLQEMLDACTDDTCPIFNSGNPAAYYLEAMDKRHLVIEAMDDQPLAAYAAVITPLYDQELFPQFWAAVAALAENDDPGPLAEIASFQFLDDPAEPVFAEYADCLDQLALFPDNDRQSRIDRQTQLASGMEEILADYPLIGAVTDFAPPPCYAMDLMDPPILSGPLDGGDVPILVIGNKSDPATPFGESKELAEMLTGGVLVEVDHPAHVVFPANPCVNEIVLDVFVDGVYPDDGTVCEPTRP